MVINSKKNYIFAFQSYYIRYLPKIEKYVFTLFTTRDFNLCLPPDYSFGNLGTCLEIHCFVESREKQSVGLVCLHCRTQYGRNFAYRLPFDAVEKRKN